MASTNGTKVIAAVVPPDTTDSFATHKAEYGKGGIHHVASEADLQNIPEDRQTEYMLATVAGRNGLLYQLVDEANDTWNIVDLGGGLKIVADNTERDNIPSDEREEGMVVLVIDPDNDSNKEFKEYQLQGGTTNNDWEEVLILTPSELQAEITSNSEVDSNTSARHTHSNKSVLDDVNSDMLDIPIEIVETNTDRDNIDAADREEGMVAIVRDPDNDNNNEFKEYQLQGGTADAYWTEIKWLTGPEINSFITSNPEVNANTNARHTHGNKAELDSISGSGSGDIITSSERTDIQNNTSARHTHGNKSTLDGISASNSGKIITPSERKAITPVTSVKTSDFTVATTDDSEVFRLDPTAGGAVITVTLPNDGPGFGNSFWAAFMALTAGYEIVFQVGSGGNLFYPGTEAKILEQYAWVMAYHINDSGTSRWYLEGRIA